MEIIVTFGIAYMTLLESFQAQPTDTCEGINGTSCCIGYRWDLRHEKCIECAKGHTGINCDIKCPYPRYGSGCQERCNCIDKECDPADGCIQSISSTEYPMTTSLGLKHKTITTTLLKSEDSSSKTCEKGYNGTNCESRCPYPSYGLGCENYCNCIDKDCNHVSGCRRSAGDFRTSPSDVQHNTTMVESHLSEDYFVDKTLDETTCMTLIQESKRTNSITFALIGLLIISFIIVFIYFYTRLFEKRVIDTRKAHCIDCIL